MRLVTPRWARMGELSGQGKRRRSQDFNLLPKTPWVSEEMIPSKDYSGSNTEVELTDKARKKEYS